jgi:hypothetical protein
MWTRLSTTHLQPQIIGISLPHCRRGQQCTFCFDFVYVSSQNDSYRPSDLVLNCKNILELPIIAFGSTVTTTDRIDDAAALLAYHWQDDGLMRFEIADRPFLVGTHERAVARDFGGENGGQPPRTLSIFSNVRHLGYAQFAFVGSHYTTLLRSRSARATVRFPAAGQGWAGGSDGALGHFNWELRENPDTDWRQPPTTQCFNSRGESTI